MPRGVRRRAARCRWPRPRARRARAPPWPRRARRPCRRRRSRRFAERGWPSGSRISGKAERMGEVAPPPGTERDLGDRTRRHGRGSWCRARSRWRSAWRAGRRASGRAARRRPANCAHVDLDEMPSRRRDERIGAGFRPVGRIRRRQLGLRAHDLAPDAAQQAEAIAADAFQRGLVPVGRADPGAGFGDDDGVGCMGQ